MTMVNRVILIVFLVAFCFTALLAQQWKGRVEVIKDNHGHIIESIKILDWPKTTPDYILTETEFTFFLKTRLHNNRIDLKYMSEYIHATKMTTHERNYWRGNFAIYKSDTADLSNATLYKYGIGLGKIKFPVYEDGHYLALIVWGGDKKITNNQGDGRMIYCVVNDGQVYLHDANKCYDN